MCIHADINPLIFSWASLPTILRANLYQFKCVCVNVVRYSAMWLNQRDGEIKGHVSDIQ